MRSYLSLVPISARVHKRQNRMTLVCIMIAVFLVTGIFSMADMGIRMEKVRLIKSHGNWHIMLKDASEDEVEEISHRRDVSVATWYDVMNYDLEEDFLIGGKKAALCGAEKEFLTDIMDGLKEGDYPQNNEEIMLSENAKEILGVRIGHTISVDTPSGTSSYTISGFCGDTGYITQHDAIGAFLSRTAFEKLGKENDCQSAPAYYVQFREHTNARKVISDIRFSDRRSTNAEVTATWIAFSLLVYGFLAIIALITVFHIINSLSMSVSARVKQYGAMRAVGMDGRQLTKMIAAEAATYAIFGSMVGCVLGLKTNQFMYEKLITAYWGDAWSMSVRQLIIILILVFAAVAVAVYAPAKRIRNMQITETINEL